MKNTAIFMIFISVFFTSMSASNAASHNPYIDECVQCITDEHNIYCMCPMKIDGEQFYNNTRIAYNECVFPIRNDNGNLTCLPEGSYTKSCVGCTIDKNMLLKCQCKNAAGDWPVACHANVCQPYISELNLKTCKQRAIINDKGNLKCSASE